MTVDQDKQPVGSALDVLALCGSLRAHSYNRGLLRAAQEVAPPGMQVEIADLGDGFPSFNEDLEAGGVPDGVGALKERMARADAVLIATPEYNYGLPGWFKNVLDWVSRPAASTPLKHKSIGILGASLGPRATARAQMALRQSFVFTDSYVMPRPELFVGPATPLFDREGTLTDEALREQIRQFLRSLADWTRMTGQRRIA